MNGIQNVAVVILCLSKLQVLDATGAKVLTGLVHVLERRGVTVLIRASGPSTWGSPPAWVWSLRSGIISTCSATSTMR